MALEWHSFLWAADQWLINYSLSPSGLSAVTLFSVGHALELYLKACNAKMTGNIDRAVKFGHKVDDIWLDCQAQDSNFLPHRELRPSILALDLLDGNDLGQLAGEDLLHLAKNQEFYIVCKYLADLKYDGAPLKQHTGPYSFVFITRNPYWASLFQDIRSYLELPQPDRLDLIHHYVDEGELPEASIQFLRQVLSG